jgi:hypothetical protein
MQPEPLREQRIVDMPWFNDTFHSIVPTSKRAATMTAQLLLAFIKEHRLAVQASMSAAGGPQAAVVGFAVTDRFEIVFDTLESTRKARNLRQNPRLAFVIGGLGAGDERTVQCGGLADEPAGAELERLKAAYYVAYPGGPSRLKWPGLVYVRLRPAWIRYSDYTRDPPEIVEFTRDQLIGEAVKESSGPAAADC